MLHQCFDTKKKCLWLDLLEPEVEEELRRFPGRLKERILASGFKRVIIDEVQKLPALLDVAHQMNESHGVQFVLTGSSARKLKRGSANLLAGRAFSHQLDPFTAQELGKKFVLQHVRKIEPFRNFLEIAAQMNGKVIEYAKISRDVGVDDKTVAEYFQILEDTLLGYFLPPFHRSIRKRQGLRPKFYLFDMGIKRALDRTLGIPLAPHTSAYGDAFEHFIVLEFHKLAELLNPDIRLSFLRTTEGSSEIDLIVEYPGRPLSLIEIKSSHTIDERPVAKLQQFEHEFGPARMYILCQENQPREQKGVRILPWKQGLSEILPGDAKGQV